MIEPSRYPKRDLPDKMLAALRASVSPPPVKRRRVKEEKLDKEKPPLPSTAAVEAGGLEIEDHLAYFSKHLSTASRASIPNARLSIAAYEELFLRNQHDHGRHFVIHQHDHPIAGTHYDLRLQINESSSVSWAIMYGLPGNPSSRRLNRNATETRVHCLWVSLIVKSNCPGVTRGGLSILRYLACLEFRMLIPS